MYRRTVSQEAGFGGIEAGINGIEDGREQEFAE
jgi:hypothetical protein